MTVYRWVLLDEEKQELRATEEFTDRTQAESWMGAHWAELRAEGADAVSLRQDDEVVYDMSLQEQ